MKRMCSGLLVLLVLAWVPSLLAQASDDDWKERLDKMIAQGMAEQHMPGLAVGIVRHGKVEYARGFGVMTVGQPDKPVTVTTLFHMASITKPFVATAIMQLVEQGKLDLDAPVTKYLPYFRLSDPRYRLITVRQLVTHTSGMPDVKDYEWNKPRYDDGALEQYVRGVESQKLLWDPGTRFAYSNMAFEVLGDVIAKVAGVSFEEYVESHILKPAGMQSSTLLLKAAQAADPSQLANGYTKGKLSGKDEQGLVPIAAYPYNRAHSPSSNLMSSVNDMTRWAMVNLNRGELDGKRILKSSTYDILWKPAAEVEFCRNGPPCRKPGNSVGISWFLEQKDGHLTVSHGGGDDGFITAFVLIPDLQFAFVMMTNSDSAGIPLLKEIQAEALRLAAK